MTASTPTLLRRPIPRTGELLPVVGLGTFQSFDVGTAPAERADLKRVLSAFVDAGGSVVDSSPMYGRAEGVVGDLAAALGLRNRLFLATKVWICGAATGLRQMSDSAAHLRAPCIDLMQVHNLLDWREHLPGLEALRAEGRVRHLGITHYHAGAHAELMTVMRTGRFDVVQVNYSVAEREAARTVLPLAADLGMAVLVNRPLGQGALLRRTRGHPLPSWAADFDCDSWAALLLKYVLGHPAVTCVIPATGDPSHLLDNMAAGSGPLPDAAGRGRIERLFESL